MLACFKEYFFIKYSSTQIVATSLIIQISTPRKPPLTPSELITEHTIVTSASIRPSSDALPNLPVSFTGAPMLLFKSSISLIYIFALTCFLPGISYGTLHASCQAFHNASCHAFHEYFFKVLAGSFLLAPDSF